jgi:hypothetical protein
MQFKNINTKCARQTWKRIFIMLTCVNMNMKRTWQGYDARLCFKTGVEKTNKNEEFYLYLYLFEDLA